MSSILFRNAKHIEGTVLNMHTSRSFSVILGAKQDLADQTLSHMEPIESSGSCSPSTGEPLKVVIPDQLCQKPQGNASKQST
jgi:hypothetical protein